MRVGIRLRWKALAISIVTVAVLSGLGDWLFGLPYWMGLALIVPAMIINGIVAEHEDNVPGGFHNPIDDES